MVWNKLRGFAITWFWNMLSYCKKCRMGDQGCIHLHTSYVTSERKGAVLRHTDSEGPPGAGGGVVW